MIGNAQHIIQHLFGKDNLEDISLDELKDLVEEFPSFNAAHFLLSKKLKSQGLEEFVPETQKTALYFTNPFWLQWLLEEKEEYPVVKETETAMADWHPEHVESFISTPPREEVIESTLTHSFRESDLVPEEAAENIALEYNEPISSGNGMDKPVENLIELESDAVPEIQDPDQQPAEQSIPALIHDGESFHEPDEIMEESLADIALARVDAEPDKSFSQIREVAETRPDETFQDRAEINEPAIETKPEEPAQEEHHFSGQESALEPPLQHTESQMQRPYFFWEKEFYSKSTTDSKKETRPEKAAEPVTDFELKEVHEHHESERLAPDEIGKVHEQAPQMEEQIEIEHPVSDVLQPPEKELTEEAKSTAEALEAVLPVSDLLPRPEAEIIAEVSPAEEHLETDQPVSDHQPDIEKEMPGEISLITDRAEISNAEETIIAFDTHPILGIINKEVDADITNQDVRESVGLPDSMAAEKSLISKSSQPEPEEELRFEPYHTIDYFASQGIKYEQEDNPPDKFGKQLKSFTAWLKTMKKLPKGVLESEMSEITEAAIQSIAEHSIEEKEVITEAMAEVLVLQGKIDRAIELYQKLSLLNPAKSAFFAARINQIKLN